MKQLSTILILALFVSSAAQADGLFGLFKDRVKGSGNLTTESRDISDFERIKSTGSFDIYVDVGPEPSLTITFDDNLIELIETEISGKTLYIDSDASFGSKHNCKINITVPSLEYVKLSGSGDVVVNNLKAEFFEYAVSGSGDLSANGEVKELELTISGSGDIDASDLKAEDVYAKISGSGDIKLYASNLLDGHISGSGDITYYGNPKQVDRMISGSGSMRKKR